MGIRKVEETNTHMYYNNSTLDNTIKPVLSDHIKQDIFLAFQTGCCLLLNKSSAESSCSTPFIQH